MNIQVTVTLQTITAAEAGLTGVDGKFNCMTEWFDGD